MFDIRLNKAPKPAHISWRKKIMHTSCTLEIEGKIGRLIHTNGRIIAEFLFHGPLEAIVGNCEGQRPVLSGRPNIFRGELFGLASDEYLNIAEQKIEER